MEKEKGSRMRLDKFLSDMGAGTRSEVKDAIRRGKVCLNGSPVKKPETQVCESDVVIWDGTPLTYTVMEYYMLYKPSGILSASRDKKAETVVDLITEKRRKDLFPVGRLDKDTEGLLLITNDGALSHSLLSPKHNVPKVYYFRVDGSIKEEMAERFLRGLEVDKEFTALPAKLQIIRSGEEESEAELTIYEGKFHQVKRMFAVEGLTVTYLKRLSMGSLKLDELLGRGGFRALTKEELAGLYKEMEA